MEIHTSLAAALQAVVEITGTDVALSIGSAPLVRVDGAIRPAPGLAMVDNTTMAEFLTGLLSEDQIEDLWKDRDIDFAFSWGSSGSVAMRSSSGACPRSRCG